MKKVNKIIGILLVSVLLVGCTKTIPTLKEGEQAVTTFTDEEKSISAEELYQALKTQYGANTLINLIDKKILSEKYPETDDEKEYVNEQISSLQESATQYSVSLDYLLNYYYGMNEEQFREYTALNYKREQAVKDKIAEGISEDEIKKYYEENIFGQINCKHILIAPETLDGMTDDEIKAAEEKALKTAKSIIKKLNDGEKWDDLAKKYSDDSSNASKGGDLGWFKTGEMVSEFEDAAFALKKGKYTTTPIKTTYGYHIILKVDEEEKPSLEDSKEEIISEIVSSKLEEDSTLSNKTLQEIRKESGMEIIDSELKDKYNEYMNNLNTASSN